MPSPLISIVIIEYYSINELVTCIDSIKKSAGELSCEIIISSNSCYDEIMRHRLRERFPDEKICFNEYNGGFAYGMNRGIEVAEGKYLTIVNPDVILLNGLSNMVEFLDKNRWVGAVGPQMVDNSGLIQDTCRKYVSVQNILLRQVRRLFKKSPVTELNIDHNLIQTVDWLTGAFIMTTREVFEATGGMDEKYFMYAEDLDWCTRIRIAGYEIVYYPLMKVNYKGSRAARKMNEYTWIFIKSHLRYWSRFGFFTGYPKREIRVID
jgi:hypothetical protein